MQMDGEELPARITARRDLTSIVESLSGHLSASQFYADAGEKVAARNEARKDTTIHLQPIENTSYGVFQTVLNTPSKGLIKNQVLRKHIRSSLITFQKQNNVYGL